MNEIKSIFPNSQANDQKIAGIYEDIDNYLVNLIKNDALSPKPLLICGGGTSSRCASKDHWTLDLRKNFQEIQFDKTKNEVLIEAGVNMHTLTKTISEFNRSFPIGISGFTGIGYILTGGISPLSRKYGLAIDHVEEISGFWGNGEKFTLHKPDSCSNKEDHLKWKALCGAAPFLAIITKIRLKTHKQNAIYAWETSISPMQLATTIEMAEEWPDSSSMYWFWGNKIKSYGLIELETKKDYDDFSYIIDKIPKSNDFCSYKISNINQLKEVTIPIKNNKLFKKQHSEVLGLLGPDMNANASKIIKEIEKLINNRPSENSYISAQQLGGETKNKDNDSSSFVHRDSSWKPWITGAWNEGDIKGREENLNWMRETWEELEDYFPGVHLAQMHPHLTWHKKEIKAAFKTWLPELKRLKSNYDPKGILPPL